MYVVYVLDAEHRQKYILYSVMRKGELRIRYCGLMCEAKRFSYADAVALQEACGFHTIIARTSDHA